MDRLARRAITAASTILGMVLFTSSAEARTRSFVTLRDDGTLAAKQLAGPAEVTASVMKAYDAAGAKRPDVISLWTTFPTNGNVIETLFDPLANDVKGIGLETAYPSKDGVFTSPYAPTRAILLHNDVTAIAARAKVDDAPAEGYARYLFLLELTHLWGPQIRLPASDGGAAPTALIGFDFHWSFWMDAGGSPAGGNAWKDNGNGTFSVSGQAPKSVAYSMLDLYLMGLADAAEVKPFGLLEHAVPPPDILDGKRPYDATSFPWFEDKPFTVQATRRTVTIEDVIAANGPRLPARSSGNLDVGIVLVVKPAATDEQVAALEEQFEPIAASLAPAFHEATHERGTLTNVTASSVGATTDAGSEVDAGEVPAPAPASSAASSDGCAVTPAAPGSLALTALVGLLLVGYRRRAAYRSSRASRSAASSAG